MSTLRLRPTGIADTPVSVPFRAAVSLLAFLVATTACGNVHSVAPSTSTQQATTHIQLSPTSASVPSGGKLQFAALVQNSSDTSIRWAATAGTITPTGLFYAPTVTTAQTVIIRAGSLDDSSAWLASTSVSVMPAEHLIISTQQLPAAMSGFSYSAALSGGGGTAPYSWSISSGTLPQGIQLDASSGVISGSTSQAGSFPFTVSVRDASSNQAAQALDLTVSSNSTGNFDGPAELPRVYLKTSLADTPAPGKTTQVTSGGDFQAALDNANCGDTIALQAGATFSGDFDFPQKSCDDGHWIIVRTSAPDSSLPPEGTRISPCYAGVASLPGRPALHCASTQNVMAKLIFINKTGYGPVVFASGANHYRLIGLEITRAVGTGYVSELITPDVGVPADHIVLDRVWVHGTAQEETARGIYLAAVTSTAVVDSFFSDFHCVAKTGTCTDSQAVGGGGGNYPAGPYKIVNNYLEAAGEGVMFGGGAATTTPADIEIRQNHFFKPLIWMPGQPGFVGGVDGNPFIVKNHFELKNGQRVLFEGNIAENTWGGFSQEGYSLLLTPKNQAATGSTANLCPACFVTDVTVRYNTVSHAAAGMQIATVVSANGGAAAAGGRYSIHDVVFDDINATTYMGAGPLFLILNNWNANILNNVSINHVTGFGDALHPLITIGDFAGQPKIPGLIFTNNLVYSGPYPIWSSGGATNCAITDVPITTFITCFSYFKFSHNALIATGTYYSVSSKWPGGSFFAPDAQTVQFVNYNNGKGGDYHLLPSSPYKNAGTDGRDLGADIDLITAATAGVR
jgi:hypothetical protein